MMFKIVKYRNNSGKILMTIETDDQAAADFCRFFGAVNKFVDLYNYRVRSAKSFDLYQKQLPTKWHSTNRISPSSWNDSSACQANVLKGCAFGKKSGYPMENGSHSIRLM
jgi:hypothetical protein